MINMYAKYCDKEVDETWKGLTRLREDEAGDLAMAKKIVISIMKWLALSWESAENYLKKNGNPFSAGEEMVELPKVAGLGEYLDTDPVLQPFLK
jgi:hypothetical protein